MGNVGLSFVANLLFSDYPRSFMGQLTLARFRGDTTFALLCRVFSTFAGGLVGMVMWFVLHVYFGVIGFANDLCPHRQVHSQWIWIR